MEHPFKAIVVDKVATAWMRTCAAFQEGEVIGRVEKFALEIKGDIPLTPAIWDVYAKAFRDALTTEKTDVVMIWADDKRLDPLFNMPGVSKVSNGTTFFFLAEACEKWGLKIKRGTRGRVMAISRNPERNTE